jgi:general secretion pathway protein F/type IV pilus assembly protein PilC
VPIVRSLEISADSTGNRVLSDAVRQAAENISAGESLATPLAASGHFPPDVVEMIAVGEQSNNLETVLPHIADTLERDTWRRLDLFVRLLEPLMLLVLAGIVLAVVIALLVPVLKMSMTV